MNGWKAAWVEAGRGDAKNFRRLRSPQWQDMVLPGSLPDKGELGPRLCCPVPVTMAVFVHSWAPTGAALGP